MVPCSASKAEEKAATARIRCVTSMASRLAFSTSSVACQRSAPTATLMPISTRKVRITRREIVMAPSRTRPSTPKIRLNIFIVFPPERDVLHARRMAAAALKLGQIDLDGHGADRLPVFGFCHGYVDLRPPGAARLV